MATPPIGVQSPQDEWLQHPSIGVPRERFTRLAQNAPGGPQQAPGRPAQPAPGSPGAPQGGDAPGGTPRAGSKPLTLTIVTASGATQLLAGSQERFKVTVPLPNGSPKDVTGEVTWTYSATGLSVNDLGYTDAKAAPGPITLTATHAATGATGSITVTVVARILQKIIISPMNPIIEVNDFAPLRADGEFSDHTVEDVTHRVTWESRDEKFATINQLGNCNGKATGNATIWASDFDAMVVGTTKVTVHARGNPPKFVKIHVTPESPTISQFAPPPLQFTAMGELADTSLHDVTKRVRWLSAKPNVLDIDEKTGQATPGLVLDTVRVTAEIPGGVYGVSEVTVNVPRLTALAIEPRDPSVPRVDLNTPNSGAGLVPLKVTATFSDGTTKIVTDKVTWASDKPTVASVSGNLVVGTGDIDDTAEISAVVPGFPDVGDSITVKVVPPIVGAIEIEPGSANPGGITMSVGGRQTFIATAIYTDGSREVLTGRNVRWESVSTPPGIVTINQKGEATARVAGTATIGATKPGTNRREPVFVTVVP